MGRSSGEKVRETIHSVLSKYHKPSGKKEIEGEAEISSLFAGKSAAEIYKAAASRKDKFHETVVKQLEEQCPISLGVIHKSISVAGGRSVKECFQQDFQICEHFVVDSNFAEGVRCVLVEKGAKPTWSHKHLLDVKEQEVEKYFQAVEGSKPLKI